MHLAPPPVPRDLLPPLLACLPTAFFSPRPPPALLPLLSPILRQRVNLLSSGSHGRDGWLSLLSWDSERAAKLSEKVKDLHIEPHPVSGELELEDINTIQYRRLDSETLQSRLEVEEFELLPVYVWCDSDEEGGGAGWRLAELRALEDREDGTEWFDTTAEATDASPEPARDTHSQLLSTTTTTTAPQDDGDDDDYWASYDRTPGRTPANAGPPSTHQPLTSQQPVDNDQDYYARYGSVQPAMDSHDPEEESAETANSTLLGNEVQSHTPNIYQPKPVQPSYTRDSAVEFGTDRPRSSFQGEISSPRPTSPSDQGSIERLEQSAESMTKAEAGVKKFVSTEVKNLFKLASSVGIDRSEFERLVRAEMDALSKPEER